MTRWSTGSRDSSTAVTPTPSTAGSSSTSGAYPDYGRLSRLDHATLIELSRERGADPDDPRKRHPLDFVLWQSSAPDEPSWSSPWGPGRPGWHIECTVMSTGALGHPIDIHGGGDDLIFPHHESEIAQAEAAGVAPYVRHWTHVAMVNHEGVKMSKSLGNLVFVRDLVARVPGPAVRLLLASHHYRQSWAYDDAEVDTAAARYRRYLAAMQAGGTLSHEAAQRHEQRFFERLDDDLDTPGALDELDAIADELSSGSSGAAPGTEGQQLLGQAARGSRRGDRGRSGLRSAAPGRAVAASPEAEHCGGDVLLEEPVEELSLRHVDRGLDLLALAAAGDPRVARRRRPSRCPRGRAPANRCPRSRGRSP